MERKTRFKRLTSDISHEKTWTWLRQGNIKRETESLLIATQNHAIRTNHIKTRIDKTQQNSRWRFCGDRDETINHIIWECRNFALKEYKIRHFYGVQGNPLGIVQEIEVWPSEQTVYAQPRIRPGEWDAQTSREFWEKKTDHLISAGRPDLVIINNNKKNLPNCRLCCPGWPRSKFERKGKEV